MVYRQGSLWTHHYWGQKAVGRAAVLANTKHGSEAHFYSLDLFGLTRGRGASCRQPEQRYVFQIAELRVGCVLVE